MQYNGFYIEKKCGNNAFSYEKRKNKKIYVPNIKKVEYNKDIILQNVDISDNIAFCEYDNTLDKEYASLGIKNFIYATNDIKKIYIFDNHNHCFYFLASNIIKNIKKECNISENNNILPDFLNGLYTHKPQTMVHFDQHKDMRVPEHNMLESLKIMNSNKNLFYNNDDAKYVSDDKNISLYTNYFLNVGNFIVPLIENNFIKDVTIIDSIYSIDELYKSINSIDKLILDIDLDFFSKDMDYIDEDYSLNLIKKCYDKSDIILICTSPYFIEFDRAKKYLEKILNICMEN